MYCKIINVMKRELSREEMKAIKGGDYCNQLFIIANNNNLSCEACNGANVGSEKGHCGFKLDCYRNCER